MREINLTETELRFINSFMHDDIEPFTALYWECVRTTLLEYIAAFENQTSMMTNNVIELSESILRKIWMVDIETKFDETFEN